MNGLFFIFITFFLNAEGVEKDIPMNRTWFKTKDFQSLEIVKHKSLDDQQVMASVVLSDMEAIKKLVEKIEKVPEGDKMKSFSETAEHIDLIFKQGPDSQTVSIIDKRLKTPSTGFNTGKSELEDSIYSDVDGLLYPDFGKILPLAKGVELKFTGFSIIYEGKTLNDSKPATVSFSKNTYLVKGLDGSEQRLEITSGQMTPQPKKFEVAKKSYTLHTFQTDKGIPLYPNHFQITK